MINTVRSEAVGADSVMHPIYMPFAEAELRCHFALASGSKDDPDYTAYYRENLKRLKKYNYDIAHGRRPECSVKLARQVDKDERFWTAAALMTLFHAEEGSTSGAGFASLLTRARLSPPAGFADWDSALAGPLELFFEVALPSPRRYSDWLRVHLDQRAFIPYVKESASPTDSLEGSTHADAVLYASKTGVAIIFESKVLSDISVQVTFDAARNQLARLVDVMLEEPSRPQRLAGRRPDHTYLVLLTPELFQKDPALRHGRLYGWLMSEYQDSNSGLLARHLGHRTGDELIGVSSRLGWATWEDIKAVDPRACAWLASGSQRDAAPSLLVAS